MKKNILITLVVFLFALTVQARTAKIVQQSEGSITFVVDKGLEDRAYKSKPVDSQKLAKALSSHLEEKSQKVLATSFAQDKHLLNYGQYAFFSSLVEAYACHHSFTISPDMIWVLISQGFARYVNAHPEEMRDKLVYHQKKKEIAIKLYMYAEDMMKADMDWNPIIQMYVDSIKANTKGDIADIISADFSTTGLVEKLASQITLMESVKAYFDYKMYAVGCGFPTITIEGTPQDWRHVIEKTEQLSKYGLTEWQKELKPLLQEFVLAAEGRPNQSFWRTIVKKDAIKNFKPGGGYKKAPTQLDGWMLKFYPDKDGKTRKQISYTTRLEKEIVEVPYTLIDAVKGKTYYLNLCAGFVGATLDSENRSVKPQIGWFMVLKDKE